MNNKFYKCDNCGKMGHKFKNCFNPIKSWGIILLRKNKITSNIEILLVRRKKSFSYTDFIRGNYEISGIYGITSIFEQMTKKEINMIKNLPFDNLWKDLWRMDYKTNIKDYKRDINEKSYVKSKIKYIQFKYQLGDVKIPLNIFLEKINPKYDSPEWGFPKGRKKFTENTLDCALREFEEETGIKKDKITIISQDYPLIENIIGLNGIKYSHIYYLAFLNDNDINLNIKGNNEIGDIGFFNKDNIYKKFRENDKEKINIIKNIFDVLKFN